MNELQLLNWQPNKSEIERVATEMVQGIVDGNLQTEKALLTIRAVRMAMESAEDKIKDQVIDELHRRGKNGFDMYGAKVNLKELGVKYDYTNCIDSEWQNLDAEIKRLTELKKERENFLKSLTKTMTIVDEITGEVMQVHPPIRQSTTSYTITFAK
jgi:hypothetical protein